MYPTLTVGSFFRRLRSTFLFFCSTTSNLNKFKPQQLQHQKRVQNEKKKQNRRPEPQKQTKNPHIAPLFFGTMRLFETFWIAPKGHPFICFYILQHNGCRKFAKGPPFYIFRHCDTVQNSLKKVRWEIVSCPQRVPLSFFFHFLQPAGVSQSPKGPPFSILSLRYGVDFGRSQLVRDSIKVVTSANIATSAFSHESGRSLMYIRKINGPRTDPRGIHVWTVRYQFRFHSI